MMTMDTQTDRTQKYIKLLEMSIRQEHLYTEEKLQEMKAQLLILEEEFERIKTSKGLKK